MTGEGTSEAGSLTVTFELPRAEQVRASRVFTHSLRSTWVAYALFGFMSLATLVLWIVTAADGLPLPFHLALLGVGGPLLVMAIIYLSPWYTVWYARKQMPIAQGPHKWTLSRAGLIIASPHTTSSLEWCLVRQVREFREFWLFRVTRHMAYVLPRRALDEATEASLRAALREWIGAKVATARVGKRRP